MSHNQPTMFMQLNPRERLGYGILAVLLLAIAGVLGYRASAQPQVAGLPQQAKHSETHKAANLSTGASGEVVVDVVGAVNNPGFYHLKGGAMIADAINAAGGAYLDADLDQLDMTAPLTDGQQIRVLEVSVTPASPSTDAAAKGSKKGKINSGTVSLNSATVDELEQLPGVGQATAQKIIDWRNSHGSFASIDQLKEVGGIGQKKLDRLAPYLRL